MIQRVSWFIAIKMSEEEHEIIEENNKSANLSDFITKDKEITSEAHDEQVINQKQSRAEQQQVAREARNEHHRIYQRAWNKKRKEQFEELKKNQIKGVQITLLNLNNKLRNITIKNENDYLKFLDDLLATLRDNQLINDYTLS